MTSRTDGTSPDGDADIGPIQRVAVIGAGWIGQQIAARLALYGLSAGMVDTSAAALSKARGWLQGLSADTWAEWGAEPPDGFSGAWRDRIDFADWRPDGDQPPPDWLADTDLVIECVPEQVAIKRRVLKSWSRFLPAETILVSNSSYFPPSVLARFVEHSERFAHLHFHAPVLRDSACDICRGPATQPWVIERLRQLCQTIGQHPIVLRREHPGYIFNWLLQSVLRAALELAARDVADAEQIDQAWRAVTGMPSGPFQIMDQIGLDVVEQALANARWSEMEPVPIDRLLEILAERTSSGRLGVKTGQGFYEYDGP